MKFPEKYRTDGDINDNGVFVIPISANNRIMIIAAVGLDWEHVSASLKDRCPTWDEMCFIKSLFWDESECVMQLHPPKDREINNHNYCLHLWKPEKQEIPMPPDILV